MKTFRQYLMEVVQLQSIVTVYQGIDSDLGDIAKIDSSILWVSNDKSFASMHTTYQNTKYLTFEMTLQNVMDLGFLSSQTKVGFDELSKRIKFVINDRVSKGKVSPQIAETLYNNLDGLKLNMDKEVWEWMTIPEVLKIIKMSGVKVIKQKEKENTKGGFIYTFGILDKNILKRSKFDRE